jgi:hypothetical protein
MFTKNKNTRIFIMKRIICIFSLLVGLFVQAAEKVEDKWFAMGTVGLLGSSEAALKTFTLRGGRDFFLIGNENLELHVYPALGFFHASIGNNNANIDLANAMLIDVYLSLKIKVVYLETGIGMLVGNIMLPHWWDTPYGWK